MCVTTHTMLKIIIVSLITVAPASANLMAELIPRYLDTRSVRVVGHTHTRDRFVMASLLEQHWDKIFFTGSPSIGRIVACAAAEHLTPCTLELGGKNPVIVAADADIRLAAKRVIWGVWMVM